MDWWLRFPVFTQATLVQFLHRQQRSCFRPPSLLCPWDPNVFSSNRIQRNNRGQKITACMPVGGNCGQQDTKRPKSQLSSLKSRCQKQGTQKKAGYCNFPCTQHQETHRQTTWASPIAWPLPRPLSSFHVRNQHATLPPRPMANNRPCYLFCCSRNPNKALPEFLVCPLINFCWLRKAKVVV